MRDYNKSIAMTSMVMAFFAIIFWGTTVNAKTLDLSVKYTETIGKQLQYFHEHGARLELDGARAAYSKEKFTSSDVAILNFGIKSDPVWLRFEVENATLLDTVRRLSLETSWIDYVDFYFLHSGQVIESYQLGDKFPFSERPIKDRFFSVDHNFAPGNTTVFMRVEALDPMVLPIFLMTEEDAANKIAFERFSYGIFYGGMLVLIAYNLMLFFGLKSIRYFYYSVYLSFFIFESIAYTGHGYMWFWPDAPDWQMWSPPFLMIVFAVSGLVFAAHFLQTKTYFPRLHRFIIVGCVVLIGAEAIAVIIDDKSWVLFISFSFLSFFSAVMMLLGIISFYGGNKSAKYFLIGSVVGSVSVSAAAMTVWGIVPYSAIAYRSVEIGMMLESILLAMALADQFRIIQQEKIQALMLSQMDPLTEINNRRAFFDFSQPLWDAGMRNNHDMSVILLDIDGFKIINDTYGHTFGDQALVKVAKLIKKSARVGDIVARWGGEEFILFLSETDLAEAKLTAERICSGISNIDMKIKGQKASITASLGVACAGTTTTSLEGLIYYADVYLHSAKEQGRNRVCSD